MPVMISVELHPQQRSVLLTIQFAVIKFILNSILNVLHTYIHTITYALSTRHPNSARPGSRERGWGGAPSPQILTFMYYCTVVKATDSAAIGRGELEGNGTWPWGLKNVRDTFLPVLSVENTVGCGADILRTGFQKVMNPHTAGRSITPDSLPIYLPGALVKSLILAASLAPPCGYLRHRRLLYFKAPQPRRIADNKFRRIGLPCQYLILA